MVKIQLVVMETTKRLEPENPPQLQRLLIFFIYDLYHLILKNLALGLLILILWVSMLLP